MEEDQGLVLGPKPKTEFLPLFNLGEPVTPGDLELVTGGLEQGRPPPETCAGGVGGDQIGKDSPKCFGAAISHI